METTPNSYSKTTHRLNLAIRGAALLFISITAFLTIGAAVDDAFIVYRYVDRLVEQKGLTFNDGE